MRLQHQEEEIRSGVRVAPIDGLGIRKSEFTISISAHSQLLSPTENGPSKRLFSVY